MIRGFGEYLCRYSLAGGENRVCRSKVLCVPVHVNANQPARAVTPKRKAVSIDICKMRKGRPPPAMLLT